MSYKFYTGENVFDAALARLRWLFAEFEHVVVNFSGGKDSTVTLNLALRVAAELDRLPLQVTFIDQEAEWETVVDYIRDTFRDPRIKPQWLQIPIKIFNATSHAEPWLLCWEPGRVHMRTREPTAVTENVYGTDRFAELFGALTAYEHPDAKAVRIAGVRASESPARFKGLTSYETYNGATWGRRLDKKSGPGHFVMYPLYDWSDSDIWKAIHTEGWHYCRLYDLMYQHGVPMSRMRVSNLHHETAVHQLMYLQEVEGPTWEKLTARLSGINATGHLEKAIFKPKVLPPMFKDWRDYRDHLVANLVTDPETREKFTRMFAKTDGQYEDAFTLEELAKLQVSSVLVNDYHGTKLLSFFASHGQFSKGRGSLGGRQLPEGSAGDAAAAGDGALHAGGPATGL
jgi:predicted phosphoadenosine phosphosulfate sulfurtransferase